MFICSLKKIFKLRSVIPGVRNIITFAMSKSGSYQVNTVDQYFENSQYSNPESIDADV